MKEFFKKGINVLILFLILDILIIVLHLIFPGRSLFNLDFESNLPTIYQGSKLVLISLLAIVILVLKYLRDSNVRKEWFWFFWVVMMFSLGIDEVAQIHENISIYMKELFGAAETYETTLIGMGYFSTPWLKYYIALFVIATTLVILAFKNLLKKYPKSMWLLIIGWIFFLGVPVVEYVNTLPHIMFQEGYGALVLLEEALEMFGATFLLAFTFEVLIGKIIVLKNSLRGILS